jgi:hypothetical protein
VEPLCAALMNCERLTGTAKVLEAAEGCFTVCCAVHALWLPN